jgi:hypothetical protein
LNWHPLSPGMPPNRGSLLDDQEHPQGQQNHHRTHNRCQRLHHLNLRLPRVTTQLEPPNKKASRLGGFRRSLGIDPPTATGSWTIRSSTRIRLRIRALVMPVRFCIVPKLSSTPPPGGRIAGDSTILCRICQMAGGQVEGHNLVAFRPPGPCSRSRTFPTLEDQRQVQLVVDGLSTDPENCKVPP